MNTHKDDPEILEAFAQGKLKRSKNATKEIELAKQAAADYLKKRLGVGFNETTADGMFTLKEGECFGACGDAPVLLVNNKRMCCAMTPDKLDGLLKELG